MINRTLVEAYLKPRLAFASKVGGLVKRIEKETPAAKGVKRISFPAYYPNELIDKYESFAPDSSFVDTIFCEDYGCRKTDDNKCVSTIRVVYYWNQTRLNKESIDVVKQLISATSCSFVNAEPFTKIKSTVTRIIGPDENVFARYSFDETVRQHLMQPFTCTALELEISFSLCF